MTMKVFNGPDVSLPVFNVGSRSGGGILTLSSHARAREALELGPGVADLGFKIFVVGEDSRWMDDGGIGVFGTPSRRVPAAVGDGNLHIWNVTNVDDAVAVFTVLDTGQPDGNGQ